MDYDAYSRNMKPLRGSNMGSYFNNKSNRGSELEFDE